MTKGLFITVEGPDGSGKSTIIPHLKECLESHGKQVHLVRLPGGSLLGEKMRNLIVGETEETCSPEAELLLFAANFRQIYDHVIVPRVNRGEIVIADRFIDTAYAYQGYGRGLLKQFQKLEKHFFSDLKIDRTLYLDLRITTSLNRMRAREKEYNRINSEDLEFRTRCFHGYGARMVECSKRITVIDAEKSLEEVKDQITQFTANLIKENS